MASPNIGNNGQYVSSTYAQVPSGHVSASEDSDVNSPQYTPSSSQDSAYDDSAPQGQNTLTRQYLLAHDAQQTAHRERAHTRAGRQHASTDASNVTGRQNQNHRDPDSQQADMTPTERFEAVSDYPYRQHSQYQPLVSNTVYYQQSGTSKYPSTTPWDSYTPSSISVALTGVNSTYPTDNQDTRYWTQTLPPGKSATDWGYDLAGVGKQFEYEDHAGQRYTPYGKGDV